MSRLPGQPPIRARQRSPSTPRMQIESIEVKGLFGKFDYPKISIGDLQSSGRVSVIYGDNGTGKTTILKLIYACLAPTSNDGLRTLIATTPFLVFKLFISNEIEVSVLKEDFVGSYIFTIKNKSRVETFEVIAKSDNKVPQQDSVNGLVTSLRRLEFDVLFVDHNRVIQSTYSFLPAIFQQGEISERGFKAKEIDIFLASPNIRYGQLTSDSELQFPLPQVVDALNRRLRTQAYRQGAAGEQSAAAVYLEIAKSVVKDRRKKEAISEIRDVKRTLIELSFASKPFISHGLLSEYPFEELISLYENASNAKKIQIESVISPFLDSVQRRIRALDQIQNIITGLETELRNYLTDKQVSFAVPDGLIISDSNGPIALGDLSSGEKQLVFLLCSAVIARTKRSLIIIDEPELSLNYKWQRMIAGSLATLSAGAETQYILASHSIEIITKYVDSSFELVAL